MAIVNLRMNRRQFLVGVAAAAGAFLVPAVPLVAGPVSSLPALTYFPPVPEIGSYISTLSWKMFWNGPHKYGQVMVLDGPLDGFDEKTRAAIVRILRSSISETIDHLGPARGPVLPYPEAKKIAWK